MSNLFLFHGADSFSSLKKAQFWQEQFIKKHGEMNIEILDEKATTPAQIRSSIQSLPFLGEKRLTIVKNFLQNSQNDHQKTVADFIDKVPEFCILVFLENQSADKRTSLYKKLQKIGTVEDFPEPDTYKIIDFAKKEIAKNQLQISPLNLTHLGQLLPPNLWTVNNELKKIIDYNLETTEKEISRSTIDNLVTPSITSSIFKLTDEICTNKRQLAFKTLQALQDSGEEITRVFYMIVRHFRILLQITDLKNSGKTESEIAKILKQHPFTVKKSIPQSKILSLQKQKLIYKNLLNIDTRIKTGKIRFTQQEPQELMLAIEQLIVSINDHDSAKVT